MLDKYFVHPVEIKESREQSQLVCVFSLIVSVTAVMFALEKSLFP